MLVPLTGAGEKHNFACAARQGICIHNSALHTDMKQSMEQCLDITALPHSVHQCKCLLTT